MFHHLTVRQLNTVGLGLVPHQVLHHAAHVGLQSACAGIGKVICYLCIKTRATRAHKKSIIRHSVVNADRLAVIEHLQRLLRTNGNTQMASQAIAATHR